MMKFIKFSLLSLTILIPQFEDAFATQIVWVPPVLGGQGYTAVSLFPFGLYKAGLESMRYQQVYGGSRFAEVSPQGVLITEIGFRVDSDMTGIFISEQPSFQINLSTTTRQPDELSTMFAENIGIDETVVFGPAGKFWPDQNKENFTFGVVLDTPFFYDPSQGNLLLDIRNFQAEDPSDPFPELSMKELIGHDIFGDDVSRVFATSVDATSGTADTIGLITTFRVEPIPEPSTIVLGLLGLAAFALIMRNSKSLKP